MRSLVASCSFGILRRPALSADGVSGSICLTSPRAFGDAGFGSVAGMFEARARGSRYNRRNGCGMSGMRSGGMRVRRLDLGRGDEADDVAVKELGELLQDRAWGGIRGRSGLLWLGVASAASFAASLLLAGCQSVSGSSPVSQLRIIDASYNAPSLNLYVEGTLLAGNLGQGSITDYATFKPTNSAVVKVTAATSTKTLASADTSLLGGTSQSALISDIGAVYQVTVLEDQATAAPAGHSEFRMLNQAPSTGAVDVYFLSGTSNTVYATAKPVITGLAVGASSGYVTIPSSTLYMVIAPTGTTLVNGVSTIYTSAAFALTGGEVRTVLIVDPLLTTEPVQVYVADDVD